MRPGLLRLGLLMLSGIGPLHAQSTDPATGPAPTGRLVRVLDAVSGRPLAGMTVRAGAGEPARRTDTNGEVGLPAGAASTLEIRGPGYETVRTRPAPGPGPIVVRLTPIPIRLEELTTQVRRSRDAGARYRADLAEAAGPDALLDWLRTLPGVALQRRGGSGAATTVSIRGSRPSGVLVLLDGVPLNDPLTGVADLSDVAVETLGVAEVTVGAVPGRAGATAGLIRLRSREGADGITVAADAGSFGYGAVRAGGSHPVGSLRFGWVGGTEGASNRFGYVNRLRAPGAQEERTNADYRRTGGALSVGAADWSVRIRLDENERGTPGHMGTRLWDEARLRERTLRLGGRATVGRGTGVEVGATRRSERYEDGRTGQAQDLTLSQARAAFEAGLHGGLRLDAATSIETASGEALGSSPTRWALDARLRHMLAWDRIELAPILAAVVHDAGTRVSPGLTLSTATRAGRVWLRGAQTFRRPGLADLYYGASRGVRANPDLDPERVVLDAELGWEHHAGPHAVRASLFWRRTHDAIVWLPSTTAVWSPRNFGRLDAGGAEVHWSGASPHLDWGLSGTVQRSRLVSATRDSRVPYQPTVRLRAELAPRVGPLAVRAAVVLEGSRPTTLSGSHVLPAHARADVRADLRLRFGSTVGRLYASVDNLFDTVYELVELFPEPGRSFRLGLQFSPGAHARLQRQGAQGSLAELDDARPAQRRDTNLSGGIE